MLYDIVLPLAIEGVLTYNISPSLYANPQLGSRVLVPIGKRKICTGIVWAKHKGELAVEAKDILAVLDSAPIVDEHQRRLWEWISSYYMCTLGEVMKAALPSALKLESETHVRLLDDCQCKQRLSPTEEQLLTLLADQKLHAVDELTKQLDISSAMPAVDRLIKKGAIAVDEKVVERYSERTEQYISLAKDMQNDKALQSTISSLSRAPKQANLLVQFLMLTAEQDDLAKKQILRRELLDKSGESSAILRALIDKKIFDETDKVVSRLTAEDATQPAFPLNPYQEQALRDINEGWQKRSVTLLHGVTSSGKTEVYIHLIQQMMETGKQVLYLVPEIALTTQLTERLRRVFGKDLGVYHSRFSDAERVEIYRRMLSDTPYKVVIGVRSAVFLPFSSLGLIIVDEEHDSSYKQADPAPRYHARSVAIMMAQAIGAKVLLGTATPSIETYYKAKEGKFTLVKLTHRHGDVSMPNIQIVDMRRQYHRKEVVGHFDDPVVERIQGQLAINKQIIVFQNRRGYSPWAQCKSCGFVPRCSNCDVSMTVHKRWQLLSCHYCNSTIPIPQICPQCGAPMRDIGMGTERVEEEMGDTFPTARIGRMDLDTTRAKNAYRQLIDDFSEHKMDILVGTQMVTKGLHFDDVSTVVVQSADTLLNEPDFRSEEHTYAMLEQVAGRAGRKGEQGEVLIQTMQADHPIFAFVKNHDFIGLYEQQIEERRLFRYPPFFRLICLTLRHKDEHTINEAAGILQGWLTQVFGDRVTPVVTPSIAWVQRYYIRELTLRIEQTASFAEAKSCLQTYIKAIKKKHNTLQIFVDVDP